MSATEESNTMPEKIDPRLSTNTIALSVEDRRLAHSLRLEGLENTKNDIIFENALLVLGLKKYLRLNKISVDDTSSNIWDPVSRILDGSAELTVKNLGSLECLVHHDGESDGNYCSSDSIELPLEGLGDRQAYLMWNCAKEFSKLHFTGFFPTSELGDRDTISIQELREPTEFLRWLHDTDLGQNKIHQQVSASITQISDWLDKQFWHGWQSLDAVLGDQGSRSEKLAFRAKGTPSLLEQSSEPFKGAKLIHINDVDRNIAWTVECSPLLGGKWHTIVTVQSVDSQELLPNNLVLSIHEVNNKTCEVIEKEFSLITAKEAPIIKINFDADSQDLFCSKLRLNEFTIQEIMQLPNGV